MLIDMYDRVTIIESLHAWGSEYSSNKISETVKNYIPLKSCFV